MQIFFALLVFLGCSVGEAHAQRTYPKVEIFAGLSYLNVDAGMFTTLTGFEFDLGRENKYGIQGNVNVNLSRRLGLTADFGAQSEILGSDRSEYLLGPRISKRSDRFSLFGHALLGAVTRRENFLFSSGSVSHTGFGMGVGGGVDVNLGRRFALRLVQADFLPARLQGTWESNFRFGFGVTVKLGGGKGSP